LVPDWQNRVEELVRSQSPSGLAMKKTDKIDIRLWPFKVLVEGHHAIAALRWAAGDGARRHGCIVGDVVLGGEI